jgi:hypothetical protein
LLAVRSRRRFDPAAAALIVFGAAVLTSPHLSTRNSGG